jgi:glutamate--cysteine ligase catalytic subunit
MKRAEHRDAVLKQKFYFRTNPDEETPKILELSCDEVINGGRGFFGLIPYMKKYLDDSGTDIKTRCKILVSVYLTFGSINVDKYRKKAWNKLSGSP